MDGVSAAASIIAILELSSEVIKYVNSARGASRERKALREELRSCESILHQLKDNVDDSEEGKAWSKTLAALEAKDAPLDRLESALSHMNRILRLNKDTHTILTSLRWPFDEKELKEILSTIEREKSLLQLALTNNSLKLLQEIKRTSSEHSAKLETLIESINIASMHSNSSLSGLRHDMTVIDSSQAVLHDNLEGIQQQSETRRRLKERQEALDWLSRENYAAQQSDVLSRRQHGTGQWLLDSPEFKRWLESKHEILFCPGIPGAGKTVLVSIVVEELLGRFGLDEQVGIAYIYCNYRHQEEQTAMHLLASLLKQLAYCQSTLPESVKSLYQKHRSRDTRSTFGEIKEALQATTRHFSRVFVVVDALDECKATGDTRNKFISEIMSLQAVCGVNVLITSREMPGVTQLLGQPITKEVRASEHDIKMYLEGNISQLPLFVQRSQDIQEEIVASIVKAVDGM